MCEKRNLIYFNTKLCWKLRKYCWSMNSLLIYTSVTFILMLWALIILKPTYTLLMQIHFKVSFVQAKYLRCMGELGQLRKNILLKVINHYFPCFVVLYEIRLRCIRREREGKKRNYLCIQSLLKSENKDNFSTLMEKNVLRIFD